MKRITLITLLTFIMTTSCGHNATIYGKGKGKFIAKAKHDNKSSALNEAIKGANETCEKRNKIAHIIKNQVKYEGDLTEDTHKVTKRAKGVIGMMGNVGAYGMADAISGDNGYIAKVLFRCE